MVNPKTFDKYAKDPRFKGWADLSERALKDGWLSIEDLLDATRVGIIHFSIRHSMQVHIQITIEDVDVDL